MRFVILAVIVALANCEPEPQYLVNPYQGGVYGAIDQSPFVPDHPRLFGFTSLLKPLFTYTYSTTTTTSTTTSAAVLVGDHLPELK